MNSSTRESLEKHSNSVNPSESFPESSSTNGIHGVSSIGGQSVSDMRDRGMAGQAGTCDKASVSERVVRDGSQPSLSINDVSQINISKGRLYKAKYQWETEAREFIREHGREKVGFLTMTVPDNVTDKAEFEKRVNSWFTGRIRKMCKGRYLMFRERHMGDKHRMVWHLHALLAFDDDIKTGTELRENRKGKVKCKPNDALKEYWNELDKIRTKYDGAGINQLWPLRGSTNQVAKYVAKYVVKGFANRQGRERLVSTGQSYVRSVNSRFTFCSVRAGRVRSAMSMLWNEARNVYSDAYTAGAFFQDFWRSVCQRASGVLPDRDAWDKCREQLYDASVRAFFLPASVAQMAGVIQEPYVYASPCELIQGKWCRVYYNGKTLGVDPYDQGGYRLDIQLELESVQVHPPAPG